MKALVTGGAGFIGSHVAEELITAGHEIVVLDDLSGGFKENIPERAVFYEGSINDVTLLEKLFKEYRFDYVYHLAAYAAEGLSHFIRRFNYENNLIGSINLLNLAVNYKIKCLVYTSSIAVYGALVPPFNEDMIPAPEDPYGIAKYAVELDLHAAHSMWGLNYIVFRPHNVYGERQNIGDRYRNVVGIFMNQIMKGKNLTMFGDGEQTRAFTYVKDISTVIADSVFNKNCYNQIFNIGADKYYTINYLAQTILKVMPAKNKIIRLPARNEIINAYSDHKKVMEMFNYEPQVDLDQGIAIMAEWACRVGSKEGGKFNNIEILENMPEIWKNTYVT